MLCYIHLAQLKWIGVTINRSPWHQLESDISFSFVAVLNSSVVLRQYVGYIGNDLPKLFSYCNIFDNVKFIIDMSRSYISDCIRHVTNMMYVNLIYTDYKCTDWIFINLLFKQSDKPETPKKGKNSSQ